MHSWSIILLSVGLAAGSGRLTNSGNNNGYDSDSLEGPVRPSAFVGTHGEMVVIEAGDVGLYETAMIDDEINYEDDVKFILFTTKNPSTGQQLYLNNLTSIKRSNFKATRLTKIIIDDGFVNNSNSQMVQKTKNAFLQNGDFNVIAVDWSSIADDSLYPAVESEAVGKYVGKFIEFLVANASVNFSDVHLIGYRFGVDVSGSAGEQVQTAGYNISRITGLDPVIQRFQGESPPTLRLDETDADFVDVIHSDVAGTDTGEPIGQGDFYPNGGNAPQPGCPILDANYESCSSTRAYEYFAASINLTNAFFAAKCDYLLFGIPLGCSFDGARMGYPAEKKDQGLFYLTTTSEYPYAKST